MNEQLAKEARRNLRKEIGQTATDALERARAEVLQLRMEHAAIAQTLAEFKRDVTRVVDHNAEQISRLDGRIDGASAWCEQNEQAVTRLGRTSADAFQRQDRLGMAWVESSTHFAERMNSVIHGSFWTRVGWVLFGIVPGQWVSPFGEEAPAQAQASVAPSQVVVE